MAPANGHGDTRDQVLDDDRSPRHPHQGAVAEVLGQPDRATHGGRRISTVGLESARGARVQQTDDSVGQSGRNVSRDGAAHETYESPASLIFVNEFGRDWLTLNAPS